MSKKEKKDLLYTAILTYLLILKYIQRYFYLFIAVVPIVFISYIQWLLHPFRWIPCRVS